MGNHLCLLPHCLSQQRRRRRWSNPRV